MEDALSGDRTPSQWPSQSLVHSTESRDRRLIEALHAFIPALMTENNVPGLNVALARRGRIAWEGAFGYADASVRRPMTPDTVFHSGSIAKPYLAVAVMQLVERGVLRLDELITDHLPFQVRNPLGGPAITVRHLLTHSSGLVNNNASAYLCDSPDRVRPLAVVVQRAYEYQLGQPPIGYILKPMWTRPVGAGFQYSNLGSATLGLIVERANPERLSYSDYVQQHIMDPLGMRYAQMPLAQIRALIRPDIWERMSTGYQTMGGAWIPTAPVSFGEFPCGGSVATPADYLRLMMAIMQGGALDGVRILRPESTGAMLTPADVGVGSDDSRVPFGGRPGLIWFLRRWSSPKESFFHTGGHMYGWQTLAISYPKSETAMVISVNHFNSVGGYHRELYRAAEFLEACLDGESGGVADSARVLPSSNTSQRPNTPAIGNVDWKASYLRGLLFAESYQFSIATPEKLTESQARMLANNTAIGLSDHPPLWDADGFITGVEAMTRVAPSAQAIRGFAANEMRISLEEAQQLYPMLGPTGGRSEASLAGLLSANWSE